MLLIQFLIRCLFLPISLFALLLTALFEVAMPETDWEHWKDCNEVLIAILPWSKYR